MHEPPVEVLDHDHLLPLFELALDLVAAAVILRTAAHIAHRQVEDRRGDGGVGDARGRSPHQHFGFGKAGADDLRQPLFDVSAHDRRRQRQAVVAVNRAFDAAGPCKRLFGAQEHRADRKQVFSN